MFDAGTERVVMPLGGLSLDVFGASVSNRLIEICPGLVLWPFSARRLGSNLRSAIVAASAEGRASLGTTLGMCDGLHKRLRDASGAGHHSASLFRNFCCAPWVHNWDCSCL